MVPPEPGQPLVEQSDASLLRRRPGPIDAVAVIAAVLSAVVWAAGPGTPIIVGLFVAWIVVIWPLIFRRRAHVVTALFCIGALLAVFVAPEFGHDLGRSCFDERAQDALVQADVEDLQPLGTLRIDGGRCGLTSYERIFVTAAPLQSNSDEIVPTVWFDGAGSPHIEPIGGSGYVFSPEGEPRCENTVVGNTNSCPMEPLGDGWYRYTYTSSWATGAPSTWPPQLTSEPQAFQT